MSVVYALFASGKKSRKTIQDPQKNPDHHQNLIDWSLGHVPSLQNIFCSQEMITQTQTEGYTDTSALLGQQLIIKISFVTLSAGKSNYKKSSSLQPNQPRWKAILNLFYSPGEDD